MEQIILITISKFIKYHMKNKTVIGNNQSGFMKEKSCQTILMTFYQEMTSLLDEQRKMCVVYFDFSKAFDDVSYSILIDA